MPRETSLIPLSHEIRASGTSSGRPTPRRPGPRAPIALTWEVQTPGPDGLMVRAVAGRGPARRPRAQQDVTVYASGEDGLYAIAARVARGAFERISDEDRERVFRYVRGHLLAAAPPPA